MVIRPVGGTAPSKFQVPSSAGAQSQFFSIPGNVGSSWRWAKLGPRVKHVGVEIGMLREYENKQIVDELG